MKRFVIAVGLSAISVGGFAVGRQSVQMPGIITMSPGAFINVGTNGHIELCHPNAAVTVAASEGAEFRGLVIESAGISASIKNED